MSLPLASVISVIIGYLIGGFLTAKIVCHARLGQDVFKVGSCNPGMANIAGLLGVKWALVTLLGDILKTVLACLLAYIFLSAYIGNLAVLYAGIGTTLGHDFPLYTKFKGGKGVTTTCAAIVLFSPLWGIVSCLIGFTFVLISKYLPVGAVIIPSAFTVVMLVIGSSLEVIIPCLVLVILMFICHGKPLIRAIKGEEPKIDLVSKLSRDK